LQLSFQHESSSPSQSELLTVVTCRPVSALVA